MRIVMTNCTSLNKPHEDLLLAIKEYERKTGYKTISIILENDENLLHREHEELTCAEIIYMLDRVRYLTHVGEPDYD